MLKSQHFDKDRYEFDPNKTWSVLEQGRGSKSLQGGRRGGQARDGAAGQERKNLVDNVKKLDEAMLALRAVAGTSAAVAQAIPERPAVAGRRPQERRAWTARSSCMDFTAPPVDLRGARGGDARPSPPRRWPRPASPAAAAPPAPPATA